MINKGRAVLYGSLAEVKSKYRKQRGSGRSGRGIGEY